MREEEKERSEANESLEAFRNELGITVEGWLPSGLDEDSFQAKSGAEMGDLGDSGSGVPKQMGQALPFKDDDDLSE
jgi:hypothetical protein